MEKEFHIKAYFNIFFTKRSRLSVGLGNFAMVTQAQTFNFSKKISTILPIQSMVNQTLILTVFYVNRNKKTKIL